MAMHIRPATLDDAEQIAAAEYQIAATPGFLVALPQEIPLASYQNSVLVLQQRGLYVVGEEQDRLLGHLMLEPMGMQRLAHILRLNIVVHPGHQGRGLGRQLLQHGIHWAVQDPRFEKIELNVRASNHAAIGLYQSLGFAEEGRLVNRIKVSPTEFLDDILMGLFV